MRTSFIPKQAVQMTMSRRTQPVVSIFTIIGIFIFLSAIVASGGVFLYKTYLVQELEKQSKALEDTVAQFNLPQIEEWDVLHTKIESAKKVLAGHVAPSRVFKLLEENTLKNVRFTSFDLSRIEGTDATSESMSLKLQGEAPHIKTIVVQSDVFGEKTDAFIDPFFHDVKIDQSGTYTFSIDTAVPINQLTYAKQFDLTESPASTNTTESLPADIPSDDNAAGDELDSVDAGLLEESTI